MHTWVAVLIVSVLSVCPILVEAGTTGEQPPEQGRIITKNNLTLVQERLKAEGVYTGPLNGEMDAQTTAALRAYQEKQGLPVSGAADETTLKQLQLELPTVPQGETN
jgi:peptidoglycan hydrolase-like protein with peptidoglycan-binding domain